MRALATFDGALILVSHDRYLVEKVATHVLMVHDGRITLHKGVRPEHLDPRRAARMGDRQTDPKSDKGRSHAERKQRNKARNRATKRIAKIELQLEALDEQLSSSEQAMLEAAVDYQRAQKLAAAHAKLEAHQTALYAEWEELEALVQTEL